MNPYFPSDMLKFTSAPHVTRLSAALLLVSFLFSGAVLPFASPGLSSARAAVTPYSDPGKTDFDTFIRVLKDHGTWEKFGTGYVFKPARPQMPMTNGTWLYTDWGWYWKGNEPYSFITDHYGNWVRLPAGTWAWRPDGVWSPHKIEWRVTETHYAWRPTPLNTYGEFLENDARRYTRPEEWIFIPKDKLKHAVQAADVTTGDKAPELLDNTESLFHIFVSYREIERPGPEPSEILPPVVDNRLRAELNTRRITTRSKPNTPKTPPAPAPTPGTAAASTNRPAITPHPGLARAPGLRPGAAPTPTPPPSPASASSSGDPMGSVGNGPAPLLPEGESAPSSTVPDMSSLSVDPTKSPESPAGGPAPLLPLDEKPASSSSSSSAPAAPSPAPAKGPGPGSRPASGSASQAPAPAPSSGNRLSGSGASHPLYGSTGPSSGPGGADADSEESRQGPKYAVWIVMSLPTITTPTPLTAKPLELYVYRPRIYQDTDGISRRVEISMNPVKQQENRKEIGQILGGSLDEVRPAEKTEKDKGKGRPAKTPPAASAFPVPAQPVQPVPAAAAVPAAPVAPETNVAPTTPAPAPRKPISTHSTKR